MFNNKSSQSNLARGPHREMTWPNNIEMKSNSDEQMLLHSMYIKTYATRANMRNITNKQYAIQ